MKGNTPASQIRLPFRSVERDKHIEEAVQITCKIKVAYLYLFLLTRVGSQADQAPNLGIKYIAEQEKFDLHACILACLNWQVEGSLLQ